MAVLASGARAPPFSLPATSEGGSLDAGGRVALVFYPADFSPVCREELRSFDALVPELGRLHASLLAISVDSVWSHRAFAAELGLRFPLLADFHPKGGVARAYGVFRDRDGVAERALYVLDGGAVYWSDVAPLDVNPGVDGVVAALERLASRDQQPAGT